MDANGEGVGRTDDCLAFYVGGAWVAPLDARVVDVFSPFTEEAIARVSLGGRADADRAVRAAREAFPSFSRASVADRIALLEAIERRYLERADELAEAITTQMGAPPWLARAAHVPAGLAHLRAALDVLRNHPFEEVRGRNRILREPIGVAGLITPWNWPANQILCKVAPAIAAGCTMVLKPSELAPRCATILAEIFAAAGVPPGVFNLVHGDGPGVGAALAEHPDVDMISFTGSTRAGVLVSKAAADSVKRVTLELGGKSPNILLPDVDLDVAVRHGVQACMRNSGQSCGAPTRMLVHRAQHARALEIARAEAESIPFAGPSTVGPSLGPVVSRSQYERIERLIGRGIDEGAVLVAGGLGKPPGFERGHYVRATVFGDVANHMTVAREEIFGPVLTILPYDGEEDAIRIANDSEYGLSGCVSSGDRERAVAVASRLRTGTVLINGAPTDFTVPFGGYKRSGNGREWGLEGVEEFLETKALVGAVELGP